MEVTKPCLVLVLFSIIELSTSQQCSCGNYDKSTIDINDVDEVIKKYENFHDLQDVRLEDCEGTERNEFIYIDNRDEQSFTLKLRTDIFEEKSPNSDVKTALCVNVVTVCDCTQEKQIIVLVKDTNNHDPIFVDENGAHNAEFTFAIPMPSFQSHDINNLGETIRAKDIDVSNMLITFAIEDNDDVEITAQGIDDIDALSKTHYASLRLKRMIYDMQEKRYLIKALDKEGKTAEAYLILKNKPDETITTANFEHPHYVGTCNDEGVCVNDIKLTDGTSDIRIVNGDYKELFEFSSGSIKLVGDKNLIKQELVILLLESKPESQLVPVNAIVSLTVPLESGEDPDPEPGAEITFERHPESFLLKTSELKELWTFKAVSTDKWDNIKYSLVNPPRGVFISEIDGLLRTIDTVPSGIHTLEIAAKGDVSDAQTTTTVVLNVLNFEIGDDGNVHMTQLFTSMQINENAETDTKVLLIDDEIKTLGYKYEIIFQDPNEGLFSVVEGNVISAPLDREADFFRTSTKPQFTLLVELTKDNAGGRSNATRNARSVSKAYELMEGINMFENIEYDSMRTAVVALVGDENDHAPNFGTDKMTLCYPNKDIVDLVKPPHLVQVKAIDLDSTEDKGYGKITYSSTSGAVIDATSGTIYPTEEMFQHTTHFLTVWATDGGDRKAELKIIVHLVDDTQIGELTLTDVPPENLEQELETLSETAGMKIRTFSLPPNAPKTRQATKAAGLKTRIFVYALDNDMPVSASKLKEAFEPLEHVVLVPLEASNIGGGNQSEDPVGYIVAVSILSVLLVACIAGAVAFWYFRLRPMQLDMYTNEKEMDEETGQTEEKITRFEKNNNALLNPMSSPMRRPTGFALGGSKIEDDDDLSVDQTNEQVDSAPSIANYSPSAPSEDATKTTKERRKSVTFRGAIEKIEIDKGDNDEDSSDDDSSSDSEDGEKKEKDASSSSDSDEEVKKKVDSSSESEEENSEKKQDDSSSTNIDKDNKDNEDKETQNADINEIKKDDADSKETKPTASDADLIFR